MYNSVNAPSLIENPASYFVTISIQTNQTKEESAVLYAHNQVMHWDTNIQSNLNSSCLQLQHS